MAGSCANLCASILVALALLPNVPGYTVPEQIDKLLFMKRRLERRGNSWQYAFQTWVCPNTGQCDPCGDRQIFGNWDYVYCRGPSAGKEADGRYDGYVTNFHFSDLKLNGDIPEEMCLFQRLKELDLDGNRLTGGVPGWVAECFPELAELDLSYNRLSGTVPDFIDQIPTLEEFEIHHNQFTGTIPESIGLADSMRELEFDHNQLEGTLPRSFANLNESLTALTLAGNSLEGDLYPLGAASPFRVTVHDNPGLCGMVPASVRYAKGYNPHNTRLGQPC